MKFRATVSGNAGNVLQAFFKEFNPENSISISGEKTELVVNFDKDPPMQIIEAIGNSESFDFNYQFQQEEKVKNVAEKKTNHIKHEVVKDGSSNASFILQQLARESSSYEDFKSKVFSFMNFKKAKANNNRKIFAENVLKIAETLEVINWDSITQKMREEGMDINLTLKNGLANLTRDKNLGRPIELIEKIVSYKTFAFKENEKSDTETAVSKSEIVHDEVVEKDTCDNSTQQNLIPKVRVRMKCIPEIPDFEEFLASLDKSKLTIEQRIFYVLTFMGINDDVNKNNKEEIVNACVEAITAQKPDISVRSRMVVGYFIKNFLKSHSYPDYYCKFDDFVESLKEVILTETEMKEMQS